MYYAKLFYQLTKDFYLFGPDSIKKYNMKSMWIIAKRYLGNLQDDFKNFESTLLLISFKVNEIVTFGVQRRYSIPRVSGQVKTIPYFLREQDLLNLIWSGH